MLWPSPTRQTFPPVQVVPRAVDMVLLKPAQSKVTSTLAPIAFLICSISEAKSYLKLLSVDSNTIVKQLRLEFNRETSLRRRITKNEEKRNKRI